jgi:DNA repair exonuclease SbcCD ATPase subunit
MSDRLEIPLNTVKEWLDKETTPIVEPLRADAKKLLEETKSKLEDLIESCDKLLDDAEKEIAKGSRKTYRRAKALHKLAGKFADLIEEIVIPEEISGKTLHQTSEQIGKTLKTIDKERTKWFRAIAPYFIMSRRRFDFALKRADDALRNFTDFLSNDYIKAESAEGVSSKVEELRQSLTEFGRFEKAKESRKHKKELLEKKIEKTHQKLEAIQTKGEVVELAQLNKSIKELSGAVKHELRHLQKPLLKFQTLVNSPGYSLLPEATAKLDEYLTDPFEALATEKEGYPLLITILQRIDSALDNKKMKLKSSRLRKAKDQINNIINKSALASLQKDCSEALNKKRELATSGAISESRDERAELQGRLKELKTREKLLEARDARFKKQHDETGIRVEKQKRNLEKIIFDLSGKNVQLVLD